MDTISNRARKNGESSGLIKYAIKMGQLGQYNPISNPNGIVDFGVSENHLMEDMISDKMEDIKLNVKWQPKLQYYFNFQGLTELRQAIVGLIEDNFAESSNNLKLSIDNMVILSGAGSCFTALSHCIMDENDYLMIQTPYYSGIGFDINALTDNHVYFVYSYSENKFQLTVKDYELAFEQAKRDKKRIKAICIVNPQNPLGLTYTKAHIMDILRFAAKEKLHVIIDELYANCIYDNENNNSAKFESYFTYLNEFPDPMRTHFIWSFSKDFCLAGMRTGVIYSLNEFVVKVLTNISYLFAPSSYVQSILAHMLNDKKWVKSFVEANNQRLSSSKAIVLENFKSYDVEVLSCASGFYLWVDFRSILRKLAANVTFETETFLFETIFNNGVYIVPGQFLKCAEPGFYRIIFSQQHENIQEGCRRLKGAIESLIKTHGDI